MPSKRKASTASMNSDVGTPRLKMKRSRDEPVSTLMPVGPRVRAVMGVKNDALLHMLCNDTKSGKQKELHFRKLVHAQIDWDSADDIAKINSWRNQLYGRAGLKAKTVVMWHESEGDWLHLYYHLLIVEATKHGLMVPRGKDVLVDFNKFFAGRVLLDADGEELSPRSARAHNAFVSKMNRMVFDLKTRLEEMLMGQSGDYHRPHITATMLNKFKEMKAELVADGTYEETLCYAESDHGEKDAKYFEFFAKLVAAFPPEMDDDKEEENCVTTEEHACSETSSLLSSDTDSDITTSATVILSETEDAVVVDHSTINAATNTNVAAGEYQEAAETLLAMSQSSPSQKNSQPVSVIQHNDVAGCPRKAVEALVEMSVTQPTHATNQPGNDNVLAMSVVQPTGMAGNNDQGVQGTYNHHT